MKHLSKDPFDVSLEDENYDEDVEEDPEQQPQQQPQQQQEDKEKKSSPPPAPHESPISRPNDGGGDDDDEIMVDTQTTPSTTTTTTTTTTKVVVVDEDDELMNNVHSSSTLNSNPNSNNNNNNKKKKKQNQSSEPQLGNNGGGGTVGKSKEDEEEEYEENMDVEIGKFPSSGDPDKMAKMQAILSQFTEDQMSRYESFRRSGFQKANMKKLLASITGSPKISVPMTIVVSGIAKMFVGELVETGRMIMTERGETGPIRPCHIREAYRRLKLEGKVPKKSVPRLFR